MRSTTKNPKLKISVIGGGPAGLYFAASIKKLRPECRVVVYEANKESIHSLGLGYTLQHLGSNLLARQNPNFKEQLFKDGQCMDITQALFKTTRSSKHFDFDEGFSVTRSQLMSYLLDQAEALGVETRKRKLTRSTLATIAAKSDITVGADGVNSLVRERYSAQFGAQSYKAKLKYSWFINESPQERAEACFYAFQATEGVLTLTSYPLTLNKQVVIIEAAEDCLSRGEFEDKSPEQCAAYLSEILSRNGDDIRLRSAGLPWYSFTMNIVNTPVHSNIALIGDAAFSYHFSLGQGVSSAFTTGYLLAQCLTVSPDLSVGLKQYENAIKISSARPTATSLASIRWLENIDAHFAETALDQQIDHFRLKNEFSSFIKNTSEPIVKTANLV
jgi:2-polyprenyl-6-methoxyphenol hydroxylase-like FAD-dependent oxidoreductase